MSQQWKRVLISGSNFEVNFLTSSTSLDPYKYINSPRSMVFASNPEGHFQTTSSIFNRETVSINPSLFLLSESLNSPTNPISASTAAIPIPIPSATVPLVNFPVVFKNTPHGGFETTSSISFNPILEYRGSQTSTTNLQFRSGSKLEGGFAGPGPFNYPGQTDPNKPLTFTGSYASHSDVTYINSNNGDYLEWDRTLPPGVGGVTASFSIPFYYNGAFQTQKYRLTLRRWLPGGYSTGGDAEYIDSSEIDVAVTTFRDLNSWTDPTSLPQPVSASFTGSFEIDGLIEEGERWQIRTRAHANYQPGYAVASDVDNVGPYVFEITGSTATIGTEFTSNLSGSFTGNVFGGYSGSLKGVTLNSIPDSQGIKRDDGILLINPDGTANEIFTGDSLTTMSIRLHPMDTTGQGSENKSGLEIPQLPDANIFNGEFETISPSTIQLATGLPQNGLAFGGSNREQMNLDLATNPGLTTTGGKLHVINSFLGNGISGSFGGSAGFEGSASIDLTSIFKSGLTTTEGSGLASGKLILSSSVAGFGLAFPSSINERRPLSIDTTTVVTSSGKMQLKTATSPNILGVGNTDPGGGLTATSINITYDNNSTTQKGYLDLRGNSPYTIGQDTTVIGSPLVKGNLTVLDSSNVTSIHADKFQTTDQFITLNSGSNATSPFNKDIGGFIIQTGSEAGVASGSSVFFVDGSPSLTIGSDTFNRMGWGVTRGKVGWADTSPFQDVTPSVGAVTGSDYAALFSNIKLWGTSPTDAGNVNSFYDDSTLNSIGSFFINTASNPTLGESNVYIFGIFD